jgi:hypothetical protein
MATSPNWPGVAPGSRGVNNALSPKYCDLSGFAAIDPKPPVLWIRGPDDQVVSDTSTFDFGHLGKLGVVPGWPGDGVYPPQPMLAQRAALAAGRRPRRLDRAADRGALGAGGQAVFSAHQMGTARMGTDPATSAANPLGELHDTPGVWIGDTSAFPTAVGVNPMVTWQALARRTAHAILAACGARP